MCPQRHTIYNPGEPTKGDTTSQRYLLPLEIRRTAPSRFLTSRTSIHATCTTPISKIKNGPAKRSTGPPVISKGGTPTSSISKGAGPSTSKGGTQTANLKGRANPNRHSHTFPIPSRPPTRIQASPNQNHQTPIRSTHCVTNPLQQAICQLRLSLHNHKISSQPQLFPITLTNMGNVRTRR